MISECFCNNGSFLQIMFKLRRLFLMGMENNVMYVNILYVKVMINAYKHKYNYCAVSIVESIGEFCGK